MSGAKQTWTLVEVTPETTDERRIAAVLAAAYDLRPCFICSHYGRCRHREPPVELAIAAWRGIGASLETE